MYYYFIMQGSKPISIKVTPLRKNTAIMTMYREMTNEQREFYLEHPTANVTEVWNCELTPPYVPPAEDVQEYAAQKVKELKGTCYASITIDKLQCEMANAVLAGTSVTYSGKRHYTTLQAKAIMEQFMNESDKAATIYETYKPQIEAASTTAIVDSLFDEAIAQL